VLDLWGINLQKIHKNVHNYQILIHKMVMYMNKHNKFVLVVEYNISEFIKVFF
jgi:hypothetical protein